MLDIKFILENRIAVEAALKNRCASIALDPILAINEKRKKLQQEFDSLRAFQKTLKDPANQREEMQKVAARVKELNEEMGKTEAELTALLLVIPKIPHASVPV